ncbi:zinc finger, CCHC-type containing protein [Tanacetum coccineum]
MYECMTTAKEGTSVGDDPSKGHGGLDCPITPNVTMSLDNVGSTLGKENANLNSSPNGNTHTPVSFATFVKGDTSWKFRKSVNFRTLIAPIGNRADVAIPLESIRATSEWFANTTFGFFLGKWVAYSVFSSEDGLEAMLEKGPYLICNNPFILKKWNLNVNLQKQDIGNVLTWVKFHGVHMTAFSRSSYARAIIELRADEELKDTFVVAMSKLIDECPKKIISDVVKNLKSPRQATRGVPVGPNVGFKSTKQIYRPVSSKNGSSTSGKKIKLKCQDKRLYINDDGKLLLVDDDGKPLSKVVSTVNTDSDNEVEEVLLEQWMETKRDDGYEPYDDDLYESHDTSDNLQAICDDLISPSLVERRNRFILMYESHRGLLRGSGSSLNISVGHPNGTLAKITVIGNLRLTANVVLFDVLVDLNLVKTTGTGSESGGLYLFDAETIVYLDPCGLYKCEYLEIKIDPSNGDGNEMALTIHDSPHPVNKEATFATQIDDNNIIFEGNLSDNSGSRSGVEYQSNTNIGDEPQTMRKSNRVRNIFSKFNNFVDPGNKKYGIENHVNYSNLSTMNFCFATNLIKSTKPKDYHEATLDKN